MPSRTPTSGQDLAPLRAAVVAAGRRLRASGLIAATEGNVSIRLANEAILITPAGRRKDELAAGDLVVVPLDAGARGAPPAPGAAGGRPSSDVAIHRAVYAARPDVRAVAHAHLPASLARTFAGEIPDPAALPETALLLPRVPFVPFGAPGSDALAADVAAALGTGPPPLPGAALLERHGALAVGDATAGDLAALDQALDRLELLEVLCRAWRDALVVRAATGRDGRAILRPPSPRPGSPARGRSRRQ
jgi:ribulose-5-phosphate 4-epimerase/fuculose-1-phosphate aldolase